jgi:hypothetical protein
MPPANPTAGGMTNSVGNGTNFTTGLAPTYNPSLPHASGYYRVAAAPVAPASYSGFGESPSGSQSARFSGTYNPANSSSTPFSSQLHEAASFSRSLPLPVSVQSAASTRTLYAAHTFHPAHSLLPLPAGYAVPSRVMPLLYGRANPAAFSKPPLIDVFATDYRASTGRYFPSRNQCAITKFRENLLQHAIELP